jgi:hypothetical protein
VGGVEHQRQRRVARLDAALDRLLDRHLAPGASPDAALFGAFLGVMREFGLALEPVVYGALRAVATLQATLGVLAPDLDVLAEVDRLKGEAQWKHR